MRKSLVIAGFAVWVVGAASMDWAGSVAWAASSNLEQSIAQRIKAYTHGKVSPDGIQKSPVPGVYEVRAGLDIFYVDSTGQYAFVEGHLIDLKNTIDITQAKLDKAAMVPFDSLPLNLAVKTVRGSGTRKLAVFEDPNCPFCRSFHKLLSSLDDVTIYTFPYPVLGADSVAKAEAALCTQDKASAWEQLMTSGSVPAGTHCETDLQKILQLGHDLNIHGTPTVFFANGVRAQGAVPPDQFMAMLDQASQ